MDEYLTDEQVRVLLQPIRPARVSKMGTQGRQQSYVEGYELRAHLNRVFGFGRWSSEVIDQLPIFEQENSDGKWFVAYRSRLQLTVCATDGTVLARYTEGAAGDCMGYQPNRADAHDLALKASETNALKRACTNLGDQFGLSLYRKGSLDPLVRQLVVMPDSDQLAPGTEVDAHITEPLPPAEEEAGAVVEPAAEPEPEPYERTEPPVAEWRAPERGEPVGTPGGTVEQWLELVLAPPTGKPQTHYARLLMNMGKEGVQNTLVEVDGERVTLRALVDRQLAGLRVKS